MKQVDAPGMKMVISHIYLGETAALGWRRGDGNLPHRIKAGTEKETALNEFLLYLREFNIVSVLLRLFLALLFGGLLGLERVSRHKAAGLRTYMLVCLGATLTMLLGQYQSYMLDTAWAGAVAQVGMRTDISRFSAQVINGIGFLGAGTIIVTGHQAVKGLTTAAGLWASACMGLVIGAGFYECVLLGIILMFLCMRLLTPIETHLIEKSRNMNLYIEFESMEDVRTIAGRLREHGVHIYDIDLERGKKEEERNPSAVFSLRLEQRQSHTRIIAALFELEHIKLIEEV